ncbi:hypothetical protein [Streptomyces sp. NPDC059247]|uniref:hypothetical protein n=1 Tax=Streptomyces sp. NPDC059247 TaxID=3346790 RepID=UPI0036765459
MNRFVLGATALAAVASVGIGAVGCTQQDAETHVESLCAQTDSDAAEAARAQTLALVDVVERGRFVSKGTDAEAGVQTFKVRTLAVYKGALPAEAEIGLPKDAETKVKPGGRYEVSVLGPDGGTWLARFTRAVPAATTAASVAEHWKTEIGKHFVEPPCADTTSAP